MSTFCTGIHNDVASPVPMGGFIPQQLLRFYYLLSNICGDAKYEYDDVFTDDIDIKQIFTNN